MNHPLRYISFLTFLYVFVCFSTVSSAQTRTAVSDEPQVVSIGTNFPGYSQIVFYADSLMNLHYHLHDVYTDGFDTAEVNKLFAVQFLSDSLKKSFDSFYEYRIQRLKRDYGLHFSAYYNYNFKPGFGDQEDVYYRQRAYLGFDWNLLGNSGLFGNQQKIKALKASLQVDDVDRARQAIRDNYLYLYNYLIYVFNSEKLRLLSNRLAILNGLKQIYRELFFIRRVDWEDVLKIKGMIAQIKASQRNFNDYNYQLTHRIPAYETLPAEEDSLPFLDVDPMRMMLMYEKNSVDSLRNEVNLASIKQKYKGLEGWALKPFVRYNFQQGVNNTWRKFGSAGLSASIPLRFGPSSNRVAEAEQVLYMAKEQHRISLRKLDLFNAFYEQQYNKYQLIEFYFKRATIDERIRKEKAYMQLNNPSFSPLQLLFDIDQKLAVETELTDLKKEMYLDILKIQTMLNGAPVSSFTRTMDLDNYANRYAGERTVYIWSKTFCSIPNSKILANLDLNEFREVLLSPGKNCPEGKVSDFLKLAKADGITVLNLIGNNQLLFAPVEKVKQRLQQSVDAGFSGVHLDVEPQALPKWDSLKEEYLAKLVELYANVHSYTSKRNMKFSVSIPVFFPENYLKEIYRNCDRVFVMAYGTRKPSTIIRRMAEEVATNVDKTVLAVRPSDFESRLQMESVIENVLDSTGVGKVAIHDLSTLSQLDNSQAAGDSSAILAPVSAKGDVTKGKTVYHLQVLSAKYRLNPDEVKKNLQIDENMIVVHKDGYYRYCIRTFDNLADGLKVMKEFRKIPRFSGVFLLRTDVGKSDTN